MLYQKLQKYISDYISRNRNALNPVHRFVRTFMLRYLYQHPAERFERIFSLKKNGRMHEYHLCLRDAAIEFARHGHAGEAVKLAATLPEEYVNQHLANCLEIVRPSSGYNLQISLETITVCNLKCPLCSHGGRKSARGLNQNKIMSLETFKAIWDKIKDRTGTLVLGGQGEIFLHPNIYDLIDYVAPTPVVMDTNGNAPMDPGRLVGRNVKAIYFSIDGIDQRTYGKYRIGGSFEKATDSLSALVSARKNIKAQWPGVFFKYISFKHNEMYVQQARDLAEKLGADGFFNPPGAVFPLIDDYAAKVRSFVPLAAGKPYVKYYETSRQTIVTHDNFSPYCAMAFINPCISIDGNVSPCGGCSHLPFQGMKNIFQNTFEEIWQSDHYVKFRYAALNNKNALPYCQACYCCQTVCWREVLAGSPLAYPAPREPEGPLIAADNLMIDEQYADELRDANLLNELEYFEKNGKYRGQKE